MAGSRANGKLRKIKLSLSLTEVLFTDQQMFATFEIYIGVPVAILLMVLRRNTIGSCNDNWDGRRAIRSLQFYSYRHFRLNFRSTKYYPRICSFHQGIEIINMPNLTHFLARGWNQPSACPCIANAQAQPRVWAGFSKSLGPKSYSILQ